MSSDSPLKTQREFLSVAVEQSMLTEEAADQLSPELASLEIPASQLVLQRGILNPVQVDIVETLLTPADVVPGYEILGLIGQGGMGVVYQARQVSLDRVVALKTVLISQMSDASVMTRFEQEAVTVGRLRHPNIVAAFDFGKHSGRLYFTMELVEGEDAEHLVTRMGCVDESTTWGLIRQAAAGLSHAAGEGIVHRDIKPANLLLVKPPEGFPLPAGMPMVKIADFGLAFLTTEIESRTRLTADNVTIGSPHYMAPEQLDGDAFDWRVDAYALGATAYHLISGRPPFDGKRLSQIIASKLTREVEPLETIVPDVSEATSALISQMMARDPDSRITDYAELISRIDALVGVSTGQTDVATSGLADALSPTTIVGRPGPRQAASTRHIAKQGTETVPPQRRQRPPRVSRRAVLLSGAALLGAGGLAAIVAWPGRRDEAPETEAGNATEPVDTTELGNATDVGPRDMIQGGMETPLFDGRGLGGGWQPNTGVWRIVDGPEGTKVISGQGGITYRPLPKLGGKNAGEMTDYRLSFLVWLNRAAAVELNFAIASGEDRDEPRYVFRLGPKEMQLGYRPGRFQTFEPLTEPLPTPEKESTESFLVTLERQRGGWWILVDGEVVGTLPDRHDQHQAKFGLAVERGPAWFGEFFAMRLVEPKG